MCEQNCPRLGCVILAAGNARRFGSNKLLAPLGGKPLLRWALEAVPAEAFQQVVVVTQYVDAANIVKEFCFSYIPNDRPEEGLSHSIALGLGALSPCDGVLFQVADQPLLRRESVAALVGLWRQRPDLPAALGHGGVRGNPCIFPRALFPDLLALTGDRGGSAVLRRWGGPVPLLEVDEQELWDVDDREALEQIRARLESSHS